MFGIVILAVYAVLMIGVTLMFTRKTTDAEGFHVADRRIGSAIAAMSIAATWIWAPSLFTSSEMAYTRGIPGMFWFKPLPVAMPMMYSEVKEAVEEYEPRAEVVNVTFAADRNAPGRLIPTVEVNIINE